MMRGYDEASARRVEMQYSTADIVEQRRVTFEALALRAGERVLDVGVGPGYLALEMARAVGAEGKVCGIDVSEVMLGLASKRCAGMDWVELRAGDAATLPFDDASFDAAAAVQVYLFVADVDAALGELHRVLRPGGRAVVVDTDWGTVAWYSANPERMRRVVAAWTTRFAHAHLPRALPGKLRRVGFNLERIQVVPIVNTRPGRDTYSGLQIPEVAKFAGGRNGVTSEEAAAWEAELARLGEAGEYFFSLNRYVFLVGKLPAR